MYQRILEFIHSRSREEWEAFFWSRVASGKQWLREHGEIAAIAGFVIGILCVLAFKLVFALVLVSTVATFVIWNVSRATFASELETSESELRTGIDIIEARSEKPSHLVVNTPVISGQESDTHDV